MRCFSVADLPAEVSKKSVREEHEKKRRDRDMGCKECFKVRDACVQFHIVTDQVKAVEKKNKLGNVKVEISNSKGKKQQ